MKEIKQFRVKESGLSLIELSIALIVIGLLTIAFLDLYKIQNAKRLEKIQNYKFFTISDGLSKFLSEHNRYPCPARRDLAVNDSQFGESSYPRADTDGDGDIDEDDDDPIRCDDAVVAPGTCNFVTPGPFLGADAGYCVALNGGKRIRIGAIPYKAIGIGKEDVIDVYGNQFTYAVVEDQATVGLYKPPGVLPDNKKIRLRDYEEDEATRDPFTGIATSGVDKNLNVDMVFFSHGEGGAGSYTALGSPHANSCASASPIDKENCDEDHIFVTDLYAARSPASVGVFDDKLEYDLLNWIYLWTSPESNQKSIFNRDSGNMGVGIEDGEEKLHVVGNLRADAGTNLTDMGKIQVEDVCGYDETGAVTGGVDCFTSEVLGGADASTERLKCPDKFFMKGIENGKAECVSALGGATDDCGGQYPQGFKVDANGKISFSCQSL